MKAKIESNLLAIESHSVRPDVGCEFLTISCPNGWDDVKKLTRKVLSYGGKLFTYRGWNSDRNECTFAHDLNGDNKVAKIA